MVRNGNVYGKITYKQELDRDVKKNEEGYKITEKVALEYPVLRLISLQELFLDPRYLYTTDMPAVIWTHERARLSQLKAMEGKEGMMNLDRIKYTPSNEYNTDKANVYTLMVNDAYGETRTEYVSTLTVDEYYGYFSPDNNPENEILYELWVINKSLVVRARPIKSMPIKSACIS